MSFNFLNCSFRIDGTTTTTTWSPCHTAAATGPRTLSNKVISGNYWPLGAFPWKNKKRKRNVSAEKKLQKENLFSSPNHTERAMNYYQIHEMNKFKGATPKDRSPARPFFPKSQTTRNFIMNFWLPAVRFRAHCRVQIPWHILGAIPGEVGQGWTLQMLIENFQQK